MKLFAINTPTQRVLCFVAIMLFTASGPQLSAQQKGQRQQVKKKKGVHGQQDTVTGYAKSVSVGGCTNDAESQLHAGLKVDLDALKNGEPLAWKPPTITGTLPSCPAPPPPSASPATGTAAGDPATPPAPPAITPPADASVTPPTSAANASPAASVATNNSPAPPGPTSKPATANGSTLAGLAAFAAQAGSSPTACSLSATSDEAVVFHIVDWRIITLPTAADPSKPAPVAQQTSSTWYVYRHPRFATDGLLVPASVTGTGDPLIYGARRVLVLNIDDLGMTPFNLQSVLSTPVTQGVPESSSDFGALFSAVTGIAVGSQTSQAAYVTKSPDKTTLYITLACQQGTPTLPFSIQINDAVSVPGAANANNNGGGNNGGGNNGGGNNGGGNNGGGNDGGGNNGGKNGGGKNTTTASASGSAVCTGDQGTLPCSTTRTFTSKEHAFFDFSAGIAVPGVRETTYTFTTSSSTVTSTVTRHTDAYAFVDLFPFGAYLPKESPAPHFNFGVPVTSQSLHRPFIGLSENVTGWTHLQKNLGLPVAINIFGGVVFMKTKYVSGTPTTQAAFNSDLNSHWVHKYMVGIEVPISSVTSKFSKSGGSKGSSSKGGGS